MFLAYSRLLDPEWMEKEEEEMKQLFGEDVFVPGITSLHPKPKPELNRNPYVDDVMRQGLCEVCRTKKATQHIQFSMYGDVHKMLVGGKTYRRAKLTVSLCDECARKGEKRDRVGSTFCLAVFLCVGLPLGTLTYDTTNGSLCGGIIGGLLFGGIAAGVVSSLMTGSYSKESICETVPRIKALLDEGWEFGDSPGK